MFINSLEQYSRQLQIPVPQLQPWAPAASDEAVPVPPLHRKCVASASVLPKHVQYDSPIGSYGGRHANTDGVTEAILNESCLSNLNQNTFCCLQAIVTLSFGQRGVDTGLICHEVLICYTWSQFVVLHLLDHESGLRTPQEPLDVPHASAKTHPAHTHRSPKAVGTLNEFVGVLGAFPARSVRDVPVKSYRRRALSWGAERHCHCSSRDVLTTWCQSWPTVPSITTTGISS